MATKLHILDNAAINCHKPADDVNESLGKAGQKVSSEQRMCNSRNYRSSLKHPPAIKGRLALYPAKHDLVGVPY